MGGQHTPGPWIARADRTVAADGLPLSRCYAGRNEAANARLIAAAPALLEALQELRAVVMGEASWLLDEDRNGFGRVAEQVDAAIAAATPPASLEAE